MRCEICDEKAGNENWFAGRLLCDGCFCEYRSIFIGKPPTRRKRNAEEKMAEEILDLLNHDDTRKDVKKMEEYGD